MKKILFILFTAICSNTIAQFNPSFWQVQNETIKVISLSGLTPNNGYDSNQMMYYGLYSQYTHSWIGDISHINFENKQSPNQWDEINYYTIAWKGNTGNKFMTNTVGLPQAHDFVTGYTLDFRDPSNAYISFEIQVSTNINLHADLLDINGKRVNEDSPKLTVSPTVGGVDISDNSKWQTITLAWNGDVTADASVNTFIDKHTPQWWKVDNNGLKEIENPIDTSSIIGVSFLFDSGSQGNLGDIKDVYIRNIKFGNNTLPTIFNSETFRSLQVNDILYSLSEDVPYTATIEKACSTGNIIIPETITNPQNGIIYTVKTINDFAFFNCIEVDSITIPSTVERIGNFAFSGCENLKNITCLAINPPNVNNNTFIGINNPISINVTYNSLSIYSNTLIWKDFIPPFISLSTTTLNIENPNIPTEINLFSNTTWNANSDETWLNVIQNVSSGNGIITITADANPQITTRTASVTLTGIDFTSQSITITQAAGDTLLNVIENTLNIENSENSSATIDVISNTTWTANSNQPWITFTSPSSEVIGSALLTISANANNTTLERTATITISALGILPQTIFITQSAGFETSNSEIKKEKIKIYSNLLKNNIIIENIDKTTPNKFEVINTQGVIVYSGILTDKIIINTSTFSSGIYTIILNDENHIVIIK